MSQGFLQVSSFLFVESEQAFPGPKLEIFDAGWLFLLEFEFQGQLFQLGVLLDQLGLHHSEFHRLDLEFPPYVFFPH